MNYRPPDCAITLGKLVTELPTIVNDLTRQHAKITQEIDALLNAGTCSDLPMWKRGRGGRGKYLLLRAHYEPGGSRPAIYIGNDPDRVKDALDKIKRHDQVQVLNRDRDTVLRNIRWFANELHSCYTTLGYQPPAQVP